MKGPVEFGRNSDTNSVVGLSGVVEFSVSPAIVAIIVFVALAPSVVVPVNTSTPDDPINCVVASEASLETTSSIVVSCWPPATGDAV